MYTVVRSVRENSNEKNKGEGGGKKKEGKEGEGEKKEPKCCSNNTSLYSFRIEPAVGFTHEIMRGVETR